MSYTEQVTDFSTDFLSETDEAVPFPHTFATAIIVFALFVLYFVLWFSLHACRLLGKLIQRGIEIALDTPVAFQIESFSLLLLAGCVELNGLEFRNSDLIVRILKLEVIYNWWSAEVNEPGRRSHNENKKNGFEKLIKLPFRLTVKLEGVEVTAHQNVAKWSIIGDLLFPKESNQDEKNQEKNLNSGGSATVAIAPAVGNNNPNSPGAGGDGDVGVGEEEPEYEVSGFYKWIPVTKVEISHFSLIVGNMVLPSYCVIGFELANIQHTTDKSRGSSYSLSLSLSLIISQTLPHAINTHIGMYIYIYITYVYTGAFCQFQSVSDLEIIDFHIYFQRNPHYEYGKDLSQVQKKFGDVPGKLVSAFFYYYLLFCMCVRISVWVRVCVCVSQYV